MRQIISFYCFFFCFAFSLKAQSPDLFKDTLDRKFDVSEWVLTAHGFIPVPIIITEPALGYFGLGLVPVFITRNTPYIDTIGDKIIKQRAKPNIYGVAAAYTANGTWLIGGIASGVIKKWRSNYRLVGAYANVNLTFYKAIPTLGEQSFNFNIQALPLSGQLIKRIGHSPWYAGINYLYLQTQVMNADPFFKSPLNIKKQVSRAGILVEYDNRDNIFTPDDGLQFNTLFSLADDALGSDYNYRNTNSAVYYYLPFSRAFIGGFRLEYQQVWGDVPFYMLPFINLRGLPVTRYQGRITTVGETEVRWDVQPRWSLIGFAGVGKATPSWDEFSDSKWHGSTGGGFRYLLARQLKLRTGIDIARGPEQWAYYIVFGTSWMR